MTTSPSALRRIVVGLSVAALPASLLSFGGAAAQASTGSPITISTTWEIGSSQLIVSADAGSGLAPFAEGELILLEEVPNGVAFFVDEGSPRLATSDPNCSGGSASQPSTMVMCSLPVPFLVTSSVFVDFRDVTVDVTVAVEERSELNVRYYGGSGKDEYYGGPGVDIVYGGPGNDSLFGGPGNDSLFGEDGDDYLEGESGNDRHFGGPGDNLIEAEDGQADSVVDCGGVKPTEGPFFDVGLDTVTNCTGSTPPPPAPAPVPPVDPPAPGAGQVVTPSGDTRTVVVIGPTPGTFVMESSVTPPITMTTVTTVPTIPTVVPTVPFSVSSPRSGSFEFRFQPASSFYVVFFSDPVPVGTAIVAEDGSWSFEGELPPGVAPGDHTLQIVGTDTDGEVLAFNIGVEVSNEIPPATIVIQGTRGSGREINAIFVTGATTGLVGAEVIPRYKLRGQSEWQIGKARRTVAEDGTFAWQRRTGKKIRVSFISGDVTSNTIRILSRKKTIAGR